MYIFLQNASKRQRKLHHKTEVKHNRLILPGAGEVFGVGKGTNTRVVTADIDGPTFWVSTKKVPS
jgi:hypothetical protein